MQFLLYKLLLAKLPPRHVCIRVRGNDTFNSSTGGLKATRGRHTHAQPERRTTMDKELNSEEDEYWAEVSCIVCMHICAPHLIAPYGHLNHFFNGLSSSPSRESTVQHYLLNTTRSKHVQNVVERKALLRIWIYV